MIALWALIIPQNASGGDGPFCGVNAANTTLVDFSTQKAEVQALGAVVTVGEALKVHFPKAGAGVLFTAPGGKWNLNDFVAVAIDVQNLSARPVTLTGELNGMPWTNSFLHIRAGQADTMVIHMLRKTLNDRRNKQFIGMNGVPGGHMYHWVAFDPCAVKTLSLRDLDGVSVGQTIKVDAIRAIGKYGALSLESEKAFFPFVDKFGQFKHRDWPGKVELSEDLKRRAIQEARELEHYSGPENWSKYGGWLKGPKLAATGHFHVEKYGGKWWLVDPEGHLFWSHGIDCVHFSASTRIPKREHYFEALPDGFYGKGSVDFAEANQYAKYGSNWEQTAIDLAHRRLRSWGMNTIGNWSHPKACEAGRTPYVVAIHYADGGKDAVADLIRHPEKLRKALAKRMAQEKGKSSEDPWCIGYFVDNEIRWRHGMNPELYYQTVRREVKRIAPNKLYLGSRLHNHMAPHGSDPRLIAAAAKHCDVVSINRYRFSPADRQNQFWRKRV